MKEIKLTQGKVALVDDEDFDLLNKYKWHCCNCYAYSEILGWMHRYLMSTPLNMDTDHKDRDKLNNQKDNLRICTRSQNNRNSKPKINCKSGVRGIYWDKIRNRWHVQLCENKRHIHIGRFVCFEEAKKARNKFLEENYPEFGVIQQ